MQQEKEFYIKIDPKNFLEAMEHRWRTDLSTQYRSWDQWNNNDFVKELQRPDNTVYMQAIILIHALREKKFVDVMPPLIDEWYAQSKSEATETPYGPEKVTLLIDALHAACSGLENDPSIKPLLPKLLQWHTEMTMSITATRIDEGPNVLGISGLFALLARVMKDKKSL